jgi:hypothetical protein
LTDSRDDVIAGAEFASLVSSVIKVSNTKGLVCEIDAKKRFTMRLGHDPYLVLYVEKKGDICARFLVCDGIAPPYALLISPAKSCERIAEAFGDRHAMHSVKNCKLCDGKEEIVAVRKVRKHTLQIDAKPNISFLSCFVIGIFMFLMK